MDKSNEILITTVELAKALGVHKNYVSAMRRAGYVNLFHNKHRLAAALKWLENHPGFTSLSVYPSKWGARRDWRKMIQPSLAVPDILRNPTVGKHW